MAPWQETKVFVLRNKDSKSSKLGLYMRKIELLLLFILIGCSSEPYEIEYQWIGGGGLSVGEEIKTEGLYRKVGTKWGDIEHGPYVEYYPNGDREEGTYRFGTKKGRYVYYIF